MKRCTKCILMENYPNISFDNEGVCNSCNSKIIKKKNVEKNDVTEDQLFEKLNSYKNPNSKYDVIIPVSGGVDSSTSLIKIVENTKLNPLVFHYNHGYENKEATENVIKLCNKLNVDYRIVEDDQEFMKKLWKLVIETNTYGLSACYICGGILYAKALELAEHEKVNLIINGYSKGQFEMLNDKKKYLEAWQKTLAAFMEDDDFFEKFMQKQDILQKQKIFETLDDFVFDSDSILVMPFYLFSFYKTDKEKLRDFCKARFDWKPSITSYPSRTTNCEMAWLNTYIDLQKMGYCMYDEEYSELIRVEEITREQALEDLKFNPPEGLLERLAKDLGVNLEVKSEAKLNN